MRAVLYVERKTSQEIGEAFGKYNIVVNQVDEEGEVIGEPLYDNLQVNFVAYSFAENI